MAQLVAVLPILYLARQYQPGDKLPYAPELEDAWLENGAAITEEEAEERAKNRKAVKKPEPTKSVSESDTEKEDAAPDPEENGSVSESDTGNVKAIPQTAEAGVPGIVGAGEQDGENLIGKIPKTPARARK